MLNLKYGICVRIKIVDISLRDGRDETVFMAFCCKFGRGQQPVDSSKGNADSWHGDGVGQGLGEGERAS